MTDEPDRPVNLLWEVDTIIIALQKLRERIRRMAQQDGPPPAPSPSKAVQVITTSQAKDFSELPPSKKFLGSANTHETFGSRPDMTLVMSLACNTPGTGRDTSRLSQ